MDSVAPFYLALLLLSVVVCGVLAGFAVRFRERPGARTFAVLVVCLFVWSLGEAVGFVTDSPLVASVARQVMFAAIPFVPVAVLALAFQYTGRDQYVTPPVLGMLSALPVMSVFVVVTNPYHGLFWTGGKLVPAGKYSVYVVDPRLWYWAHIAYTYALLVVASYLFVRWGLTAGEEYRQQARYLLIGIAFPWAANVAKISGLVGDNLDPTPLLFTVSGFYIGLAVFRFRFLDLVPVARDTVVEVMRDGVVVLDEEDRIVDANPAVERLLDVDADELVGSDAESVAPPALVEACLDDDVETTVTLSTPDGERAFDVRRSELPGGARMVLLYDVTERRQQAEQLARQNERLEKFGSVLSHDLRNPLNVAHGYVQLLADEAADEEVAHARRAQEALDRMEALVDDTLALTREGHVVTDPEPVSLKAVAENAWRSVDTDGATLEGTTDMIVDGNEERLQRLFENLFRNSIEHGSTSSRASPDDPVEHGSAGDRTGSDPIHVWIDRLPDGFAVADDGCGIPEAQQDEVLDLGFTTSVDGTGLGLSIVNEIAEAHGWHVDVSESEAGGTRIEFHGVQRASGRETP